MSATLFKEVSYSLSKLIQDIEMGEIGLPDIQRPFVWPNTKVRDLFDSMYKGFPVGYLLFWANVVANGYRQIGADSKQKIPRLLIVDGQQRLTSLYAVLKGIPVGRENYRKEPISVAFRPKDQKFEVTDAAIRRDPEFIPDISQRNLLARWFFMTALTGRYTNSPETVMEQDLSRLRDIKDADEFVASLGRIISDTLTDDYWDITLPNELATSSPRSPSLFAYYAALNLLDARVLFSKRKVSELLDPAMKARKSAIERHHLFPKAYLAKLGIKELRDTNQIANYALVEWSDNIDISDRAPAEYFPRYVERFSPAELSQMYYWHALPEGWEIGDYRDFLALRRSGMARVIRDGFQRLCQ
jgi:hypothetical protein